ncbi:MAG: phosphate ABC transporter substrate-binding protein PstS [Nitrososphaerota archaeon]|nr:phosphate ABC transporter substrate-binding protein PstS [Nitrososphaerota archaeon]
MIVVVVMIVSALAGYYAAGTSISTTTTTSVSTTTLPPVTTTVTVTGGVSTSVSTSVQTTIPPPTLPSSLPSETISETGSTLLYPLFNLWVPNFTTTYSNVRVNTAGTGSGTGISSAAAGTVQIGASDAYLTSSQASEYPNLLNIPLAISAQQINYNLPMIPSTTSLNFSGNVLAGIYNGSISFWDNAAIKAINPGVASLLPHQTIVPIHRSDGSGDTFIFTSYLSDQSPDWAKTVGFATSVSWPSVPAAEGAIGNGGMVQACAQTEYSIAYIGISFFNNAKSAGLGHAHLKNAAGNYVDITEANILSAAQQETSSTPPDETLSMVNAPGANSYPIINYEYAIVGKTQADANTALVVRTLLDWAILPAYGNSAYFLSQVGFVPLPPAIASLSYAQIAEIGPQ